AAEWAALATGLARPTPHSHGRERYTLLKEVSNDADLRCNQGTRQRTPVQSHRPDRPGASERSVLRRHAERLDAWRVVRHPLGAVRLLARRPFAAGSLSDHQPVTGS